MLVQLEMQQSNQEKNDRTFILNGLDTNGGLRSSSYRAIGMRIIKFYSKIFNMEENDPTITKAVYRFNTFYIIIYDSSAKEVKYIIAAVTFRCDFKKKCLHVLARSSSTTYKNIFR